MINISAPAPIKTMAKAPSGESGWRTRRVWAFAIVVLMIVTVGAMDLDWSGSVAMALGQLAGMIAPVLALGALAWAVAAASARQR